MIGIKVLNVECDAPSAPGVNLVPFVMTHTCTPESDALGVNLGYSGLQLCMTVIWEDLLASNVTLETLDVCHARRTNSEECELELLGS